MTREEVIQSLRVCINAITSISECEKCSFRNEGNGERCLFTMMRAAADMLEADGEQLEVAVSSMQGVLVGLKEINQALDNTTNNNVATKSADEMLQELGLHRVDEYIKGSIRYEDPKYGDVVTVIPGSVEFSDTDGGYRFITSSEIIHAVCKLLDEMGAS